MEDIKQPAPPLPEVPGEWAMYLPIVAGLIRTFLGVVGSAGFTWALAVTADQTTMISSALLVLIAACWSAYQKMRSVQTLRRAAAAPAGTTNESLPL